MPLENFTSPSVARPNLDDTHQQGSPEATAIKRLTKANQKRARVFYDTTYLDDTSSEYVDRSTETDVDQFYAEYQALLLKSLPKKSRKPKASQLRPKSDTGRNTATDSSPISMFKPAALTPATINVKKVPLIKKKTAEGASIPTPMYTDDRASRQFLCPHCTKNFRSTLALEQHFDAKHAEPAIVVTTHPKDATRNRTNTKKVPNKITIPSSADDWISVCYRERLGGSLINGDQNPIRDSKGTASSSNTPNQQRKRVADKKSLTKAQRSAEQSIRIATKMDISCCEGAKRITSSQPCSGHFSTQHPAFHPPEIDGPRVTFSRDIKVVQDGFTGLFSEDRFCWRCGKRSESLAGFISHFLREHANSL